MSIIAGGLSFVGSASAIDLIVNGSFETAGTWQYFATYNTSTAYYTGPAIPASENPGAVYSCKQGLAFSAWDHFTTPTTLSNYLSFDLRYSASQIVTLTNALTGPAIDTGLGRFTFSSWLSSYGTPSSNPEQPFVALRFFDSATNLLAGNDVFFDRTTNTYATTFASGVTAIPADLTSDHQWVKYVAKGTIPANARYGIVYLNRSPNAPKVNSPDTYIDLVKLDVSNINDNTFLAGSTPGNNANVTPDVIVSTTLQDAANQVVTNTVQLFFDGVQVAPSIQKSAGLTVVQYDPPGLLAAASSHTYKVVWNDNEVPAVTKSNQFTFTTGKYVNLNVGTPVVQETFDGVAEGSLPAGWSVTDSTDSDIPGADLNNFHSDSYLDWVVISRSTLSNLFGVVPGGGDYTSTTNVAPLQFVNGAQVQSMIGTNFAFAASSDRYGSQVQNLFTTDYNLAGRTNIYLLFKNVYVQNQNSVGAVEYSINGGATWLPALYLLDTPQIVLDAQGNIDASNTLAAVHANVPGSGNYGSFIGLDQSLWSTAAPFISPRTDDDLVSSKRVEAIRLTQADNQATVRVRFTQAGANSYYFGIDDFGLYSPTAANPPLITSAPASQSAAIGNSATLTVAATGAGPFTFQWQKNGSNVSGANGPALIIPTVQASDAGSYTVVVNGGGLSVTSSPAAVLTVINPAVFVTGQWDFHGNLAATLGQNLQYFSSTISNDTTFGTTAGFGIASIGGQSTNVLHFIPSVPSWGGYVMAHGAKPNGGGTKVNQYTLIYDVLYPSSSSSYRALLQGSLANNDDADMFINPGNGLGISSQYSGNVTPDVWHRIAFAFDLSGPGAAPVLEKFIDGVKVAEQTTGLSAVDGRFSLLPTALLFADNDGDTQEAYVSSIQFSNGRRPDVFIESLGGPTAAKIPGSITATGTGSNLTISWTGGVPLESASALNGSWTTVTNATSPYVVPGPLTVKFYRPKLQ